jgi:hypothetical protein
VTAAWAKRIYLMLKVSSYSRAHSAFVNADPIVLCVTCQHDVSSWQAISSVPHIEAKMLKGNSER